jgi:hypothetical protein
MFLQIVVAISQYQLLPVNPFFMSNRPLLHPGRRAYNMQCLVMPTKATSPVQNHTSAMPKTKHTKK